jgi:hypothetical protein
MRTEVDVTCRLQEVRPRAPIALAARMARVIALTAPTALGLFGASFHEPFHADGGQRPMAITERSDQNRPQRRPRLEDDMVRQDSRTAYCTAELSRSRNSRAAPLRGTAGTPVAGLCVGTPARHGRAAIAGQLRRSGHAHGPAVRCMTGRLRRSIASLQSPRKGRPADRRTRSAFAGPRAAPCPALAFRMFVRPPLPGMRYYPLRGGEVWERARDRGGAARYLQPGVDVLQVDAHGSF